MADREYRTGDIFKLTDFGSKLFILVQVKKDECCLVSLVNGNRFMEPVYVDVDYNRSSREEGVILNEEQFKKCTDGCLEKVRYVGHIDDEASFLNALVASKI